MEAPTDSENPQQPESAEELAEAAAEKAEQPEEDESDILIAKAQSLVDKLTANPQNPSPSVLHALSSLLELEVARYMVDADPSATTDDRSSHNVGRLGNLIRDNDEFFDLISSKFLTESRYSVSVQAATMRLFFSCSMILTYTHAFEDDVLDKIRGWVMDETSWSTTEDRSWKHETGETCDSEMLRTYSTGLLALCLASDGTCWELAKYEFTKGVPAMLMRYLRVRVLGDSSKNLKDANILLENKYSSTIACPKTKLEAVRAAGDDAAEVVKTAGLEEYSKTNDEEAAVNAASRAASTVIDAAGEVALSSSSILDVDSGNAKLLEPESNEDIEEFFILDSDSLGRLRERFCIQCLAVLGEYVEVLGPVLQEKGVDVCLALLLRGVEQKEASSAIHDILKLIGSLARHQDFAALFVDGGGMERLLAVPRNAETFFGLSSCLFTIGSVQEIMERVCALPSSVLRHVVELGLELLQCPPDHQARNNAALFFGEAFVSRAVIEAFGEQRGLQKLFSPLHKAASVRSGVPPGSSNNSGPHRNEQSPDVVLTSLEKQIAYHSGIALWKYFRAHLLILEEPSRPRKRGCSATRNTSSNRSDSKPLDLSNEAMDDVFRQIRKDGFVTTRWDVVDEFLKFNCHVTLLELCQARDLHDMLQYALGVLHIVTLVPSSCKFIVNAPLSNGRVGIAVILDAANGAGYVFEPEIVEPALNLLINLVCPPPSISNRPTPMHGQQASSIQTGNGSNSVSTDRGAERNVLDRSGNVASQNQQREQNVEPASVDRGASSVGNAVSQASTSTPSGLVGDRRISLGPRSGLAGVAAQLEQGYRQARDDVRANNGIKVLLQLLQPRRKNPSAARDCIRALTCRVLLGLARDDTIADMLTKLLEGEKLSELIQDSRGRTSGGEHNRWKAELADVALQLIGVVTDIDRASTLAASDGCIERAAIAAATPRDLLLLFHEHLQASGLAKTAAKLVKEAKLTPLPSLAAPSSLAHQASGPEASSVQLQASDLTAAARMNQISSSQHGLLNDPQVSERLTSESLLVQFLKHQHRQCSVPITTLQPLSLLDPHVCPEPKRSLDAPSNVDGGILESMAGGDEDVDSRSVPYHSNGDEEDLL